MANATEELNLEFCLSLINFKLNLNSHIWLMAGLLEILEIVFIIVLVENTPFIFSFVQQIFTADTLGVVCDRHSSSWKQYSSV